MTPLHFRLRQPWRSISPSAIAVASCFALSAGCSGGAPGSSASVGPWTASETVLPADLARELASAQAGDRPVVVYTGPPFLYRSARIPGAVAHGPASSADGLADLRAWARSLPRSSSVVIYCGCCPLRDCPNLRPSFAALRDMGFARLRVLILPNNFGSDWAAKGFPVER
jgi:hypothetical protein